MRAAIAITCLIFLILGSFVVWERKETQRCYDSGGNLYVKQQCYNALLVPMKFED